MAKKGSLLKTVIGLGSLAVAGKVAYDKYRNCLLYTSPSPRDTR